MKMSPKKVNEKPPLPKQHVYTIEEVAKMLRISRNHAYNCVKSGELPSIKLGDRLLVPDAALERMLSGETEA
jgi:excisionase family DNA binding protein